MNYAEWCKGEDKCMLKKLQSLKQRGPRDRNKCAHVCMCVCVRVKESMVAKIWNFFALI